MWDAKIYDFQIDTHGPPRSDAGGEGLSDVHLHMAIIISYLGSLFDAKVMKMKLQVLFIEN